MAREAKNEPKELTVEQKLKALYQLQTTLSKIDEIKTLRGELPLEVQDLEDEIAGLSTRIDKIKSEVDELKSAIAGKRVEIEAAKASVEKYKSQQDNVRNNREYDFLTKEIEFQSLEMELCEKRIKEFTAEDEVDFKAYLSSLGDSIVCVADDEVVKIHVHTNDPGLAIQRALTYGSLSRIKIDNMREEHQEKLIKDAEKIAAQQAEEAAKAPKKEVGFISVSIGEGFGQIFRDLGVDYLIEGGQTMNPSTEDMLNAISKVNAEHIFILPNNKNIILAAEQARDLTEDKKIIVLPTKTIPQGISAMIGYMPEAGVDENEENMKEAYQDIASGQVTYAVRDTVIDGKEIHNGDIMGINDDGIAAVGKNLTETTLELLSTMADEDSELICLYYGADVTKDDADTLSDAIEDKFPECEVEVNFGGQPKGDILSNNQKKNRRNDNGKAINGKGSFGKNKGRTQDRSRKSEKRGNKSLLCGSNSVY